jgi:hypothetical protein
MGCRCADGFHQNHPHTIPLQYWRWPGDIDEDKGYKAYGSLVTDPSSQMDQALSIIQQKFDESDNGVILGTEEFDQIGSDAIYGYASHGCHCRQAGSQKT